MSNRKEISSDVVRGPRIVWNYFDIKRMVDKHGLEKAITELAGKNFSKSYVREMVTTILQFDK